MADEATAAAPAAVSAAATAAPIPAPPSRPHSASAVAILAAHARGEGHFATPKVFATPVIPQRPMSATSASNFHANHSTRPHFGAAGAPKRSAGGENSLVPLGKQKKRPATANAGSAAAAAAAARGRSTSPNDAPLHQQPAVLHGQQMEVSREAPSRSAVVSPRIWEHWAHGSPGRAAAEEAHARETMYSTPKMVYTAPRPSIPHAHSVLTAGGVIRGRAFMGEAAMRPTSATSARSAGSGSNRSGGRRSPTSARSGLAFPPQRVITAELSALRAKFGAAAAAAAGGGFAAGDYHHQQQRPHTSPHGGARRRPGSASSSQQQQQPLHKLYAAQQKQMMNENSVDPHRMRKRVDDVAARIVDMGTGTSAADDYYESSSPSGRIPPQMQHDAIVKRTEETAKMLRREDRQQREQDKRIRNFKARALVHSATQMARQRASDELKEIKDKLVWARMRRDAVENEIYELKDQLAALPGGGRK